MNANSLSVKTLSRKAAWFFQRFHLIIYFIVISASFGAAVLYLNTMLKEVAADTTYTSDINAGSIDTTTLERIKNLRASSDVKSLPALPSTPRSNPFSE